MTFDDVISRILYVLFLAFMILMIVITAFFPHALDQYDQPRTAPAQAQTADGHR